MEKIHALVASNLDGSQHPGSILRMESFIPEVRF